jgi:2-keto-4-pentenoate hydratase/2-oxohepta-3-ene-1,7-dioic acid hydratase in catechol pathway
MRFASYLLADGRSRVGAVSSEGLIHECPPGTTLLDLLPDPDRLREANAAALADPRNVFRPAEVTLTAPVPVPPSVRDFMAFEQHLRTVSGRPPDPDWYELPAFYFSNPAAVTGPRDDVPVPPGSTQFDYELEVAAVIGRPGTNLSPEEAVEHIAGYCVLCDFSARDLQAREMALRLGPAKGKDTATSCGPYLVTPDELAMHRSGQTFNLTMTAQVNGRLYSSGRLNSMYWSFPELVSYASRGTTVVPGDVIGSGTVGTGCILELSITHGSSAYPWLQPGDQVVLEVDTLGRLEHRIVPGPQLNPLRPARSTAQPDRQPAGSSR